MTLGSRSPAIPNQNVSALSKLGSNAHLFSLSRTLFVICSIAAKSSQAVFDYRLIRQPSDHKISSSRSPRWDGSCRTGRKAVLPQQEYLLSINPRIRLAAFLSSRSCFHFIEAIRWRGDFLFATALNNVKIAHRNNELLGL
jgi:hypothetical protein